MRRILIPAALAATAFLAACGPTAPAAPGASAGASAAPSAGASAAASAAPSSGPAATAAPAAVVADLATAFPLSQTGKRRLLYTWTATTTKGTASGTDEAFEISKCDSSCSAYVTRINGGKTEAQRDSQTMSLRQGVLIPTLKVFKDQTVEIEAELAKGGTWPEETITLKNGKSYKTQKLSYGGSRTFTYWIQKPYVLKAEYKNTDEGTTMELQTIE